jgi:hypothetical protein
MTKLAKIEARVNRNPDNVTGKKVGRGFIYTLSELVRISFCPTQNNPNVYAVRVYSADMATQYHYQRYDTTQQGWAKMADLIEHWESWAIDKGLKKDYKYERIKC